METLYGDRMWRWSKLSSSKWADAWEERFYGNSNSVITEIKGGKSIRIEVYCPSEEEANAILFQFGGSVREIKNENWVAVSAPKTAPLLIRNRLVVSQVPLETEAFPDKQIIIIPPEMAFGTGDHPTTSTCLRLLVDQAEKLEGGWSFLDLGTGSGLLAIAARFLGAGEIEAFDFDPKAVEVAQNNALRNQVENLHVFEADVFKWSNTKEFKVVAANLFSTVLIEALPLIRNWIRVDGYLILSGILSEQWPEVLVVATKSGFRNELVQKKGKWVTASFSLR